ncbi:MAG: YbhB/YbcL family Raf kinase inhibitor-like protein [Micromonosporaceae bacterium]
MAGIELRSTAFNDNTVIPHKYAHDGQNVSPALEWSGVPDDATELLLLCEDPDAPSGTFLHWLVTGIDPTTGGVAEGRTPQGGREWPNDFGETGYGGPQPPRGDPPHRYFFRLYALPEPPRLGPRPSAEDLHAAVDGTALASGNTVGLYQR